MTTTTTQTMFRTILAAAALTLCGACDEASDELGAEQELRDGIGDYTSGRGANNFEHLAWHLTTNDQLIGIPRLESVLVENALGFMVELDSVWSVEGELHGKAGHLVFSGEDFLGSIWHLQIGMFSSEDRTITAVDTSGPVDLYEVEVDDGSLLCGEHSMAVVLDDLYLEGDGSLLVQDDTLVFGCEDGGLGKAVLWGYEPWGPAGRLGLQAATRLAIADYCGDGVGHTEAGEVVWMFDKWGIHGGLVTGAIEAVWNAGGATCLSSPRASSVARSDVPCASALPLCPSNPPLGGSSWLKSW